MEWIIVVGAAAVIVTVVVGVASQPRTHRGAATNGGDPGGLAYVDSGEAHGGDPASDCGSSDAGGCDGGD